MYSQIRDEHSLVGSQTRHLRKRRIFPRHVKGYVWLTFLLLVFVVFLLSENGISVVATLTRYKDHTNAAKTSVKPPAHRMNDATLAAQISTGTIIPMERTPIAAEGFAVSSTTSAVRGTDTDQPWLASDYTSMKSVLPVFPTYGSGNRAFTPDDVVILFKTGTETLWKRVPMFLSTSFANKSMTPNIVIYSDQPGSIAGYPIVDALANVSDSLEQSADFETYRKFSALHRANRPLEHEPYVPGGWRLDKYKFLPLVAHAAAYYPVKKWYVYMEDDCYYFWHSLYTWLGARFSHTEPYFLGGPGAKLGEDFAHGGSGFMISGPALAQVFGSDPELATKHEYYAAAHCCGDQVLSHVMTLKGVPRYRGYDHTGWAALQALPTSKMAFGFWNWCSPIFSVHKVSQSEISQLHELEKAFHSKIGHHANAIMRWSYLFRNLVGIAAFGNDTSKSLDSSMVPPETVLFEEWDNLADEKMLRSDIEIDEHLSEAEREQKPWFSHKACEKACEDWHLCLSFKFQDDSCGLSSTVSRGQRILEGVRMVSGYMGSRIRKLTEQEACASGDFDSEVA